MPAETVPAPTPAAAEVPVDPKYAGKSTAEVIEMHKQAEKLISSRQPAADPSAPPPSLKIDPAAKPAVADTVEDVLARAGLDANAVATTFHATGRLTDEQYAALAGQGYGRGLVDGSLRSQLAAQQGIIAALDSARTTVFNAAGGEANYRNMLQWASGSLTDAERAHYNALADGPKATPESVRMGAEWLMARYRSHVTGTSAPQGGGSPSSAASFAPSAGGSGAFESQEAKGAAMSDPRYGTHDYIGNVNSKYDAGYTDNVNKRLLLSTGLRRPNNR